MSNVVFPVMRGLQWDVKKVPQFSNKTLRAQSLREYRAAFAAYPLWTYKMAYDVLSEKTGYTELEQLCGFFLARQGSFDSFLFTDPSDNSVTDQAFGVGDGVTAAFQLIRTFGAGGFTFNEPVENVNAMVNVKDAGSVIPAGAGAGKYTISSTGVVTFGTVPTNGHSLTWSGTYYYRVRFNQDEAEFNQFQQNLWELKKLEFVGAPGNKV